MRKSFEALQSLRSTQPILFERMAKQFETLETRFSQAVSKQESLMFRIAKVRQQALPTQAEAIQIFFIMMVMAALFAFILH